MHSEHRAFLAGSSLSFDFSAFPHAKEKLQWALDLKDQPVRWG